MLAAELGSARAGQGGRDGDELYIIYVVQERVVARFHQETNRKDAPGSAPPINCCRHILPPQSGVSAELPPVTYRERTPIT